MSATSVETNSSVKNNRSVEIAETFWREVWQAQNPKAAATLVAEDFVITSGGVEIAGCEA